MHSMFNPQPSFTISAWWKKFRWLHNDANVYALYTESVAIENENFSLNKTNSENIHWCQTTQMRVLLLYCFWSHALCVDVGFFPLSSTFSSFLLRYFGRFFPIYFAIWSLWVCQCMAQQNDNNRRWRLRQRFKCIYTPNASCRSPYF